MLAAACAALALAASAVIPASASLTSLPGRHGHPVSRALPPPPGLLAQVRPAEMQVLQQINVPGAWRTVKGSGVTVAVLDTGVDATVPDLAGQVTIGPDYVAAADPAGYHPPLSHGTYIASLIAGHGQGPGDGEGVIGVAPQAKVLSVRVIPDDNEPGVDAYNSRPAFADVLGKGIYYAVRHGARVINMSLGSNEASADLRTAVAYALSHGVVVVASAGNTGTFSRYAPYVYPASFPGVIAVAAVNVSGARAGFSQQNSSVVVSAPGVSVLGAGPGGQYMDADGTSPAGALVAGVATLIRSRYPALSPAQVEQALVTSATRRPPGDYSVQVGFGEVDAIAALTAAGALAAGHPAKGAGPVSAGAGEPGGALPPIEVVHRDRAAIAGYTAAATAAAMLAVICLAALVALARKSRRHRAGAPADPGPRYQPYPPPAGPPGDDLIG